MNDLIFCLINNCFLENTNYDSFLIENQILRKIKLIDLFDQNLSNLASLMNTILKKKLVKDDEMHIFLNLTCDLIKHSNDFNDQESIISILHILCSSNSP